MHWRIGGRWSWGTSFCGGTNNVKRRKGGKCYYEGKTTIHRSVVECTASHKGADNDRSTMKVDGDGKTWSGSDSKEKMHNPG